MISMWGWVALAVIFLGAVIITYLVLNHKAASEAFAKRFLRRMGFYSLLIVLLCLPAVAEDPPLDSLPPFQPNGGGPAPISLPELSRAGEALQGYIFGSAEDEATWRAGALCFLNITNLTNNSSENMTA